MLPVVGALGAVIGMLKLPVAPMLLKLTVALLCAVNELETFNDPDTVAPEIVSVLGLIVRYVVDFNASAVAVPFAESTSTGKNAAFVLARTTSEFLETFEYEAVPCTEAVTPAVTCNDPVISKLFVVAYVDPVNANIPPPPPAAFKANDAVAAYDELNAVVAYDAVAVIVSVVALYVNPVASTRWATLPVADSTNVI